MNTMRYADVKEKITEKSVISPNSLHGLMHLTREIIIRNKFSNNLNIRITQTQVSPNLLESIKSIIESNTGHCKIIFQSEVLTQQFHP